MSAFFVSPSEIAIASVTLLLGSALSIALSLRIHRTLWIAAARMVSQLVVVGYVLRFVFRAHVWWMTAAVVAMMLAAATFEVASRQQRRLAGLWHYGIGAASMTIATTVITGLALASTPMNIAAWGDARRLVPIIGIVLGSALNAASVGLHMLLANVMRDRAAIETQLALGAERADALRPLVRESVRSGIIPVMNQMAGAGVVTMPGIMTGQILAGMDPLRAAESQILIMLLLAGAAVSGVVVAVSLAVWRLTDERDRLRLDRLR